MKILYFTPYNILRAQTNQNADIKLCEGFAQNNCDVELYYILDKRDESEVILAEKIYISYNVEPIFNMTAINIPFNKIMFKKIKNLIIMLCLLIKNFRLNSYSNIIIVSRSIDLLIPFILRKKYWDMSDIKIVHWAHETLENQRAAWIYRNVDGIISTNSSIKEDLIRKHNMSNKKIELSYNPISVSQWKPVTEKKHAREMIGYRSEKPLVVYTGKIYKTQQEIRYILHAAHQNMVYNFLITGGKPEVVSFYKNYCTSKGIKNVIFTGFLLNYSDIRFYQLAADLLISYYSIYDHNVRHNLPNKICEYMASGNPMLTPDFPSTHDILNEKNCYFVEPDKPEALAQTIRHIFANYEEARHKAARAYMDVQNFTYDKIAGKLKDFLMTL